jgi:MFS family permease
MLGVLLFFYTLSYCDRYILTMLVGPIKQDLLLSDFQMSLILGPAFALAYGVFGLPLGWAADRHPRRWVITIGVVLWSVSTVATGLARGFASMLMARACVAVGEAALSPAAYSLIGDKFPPHRIATASSIYQMGVKLGSAAAFSVGAIAIAIAPRLPDISILGMHAGHAWQKVCLLLGAPGIVLALLTFTFSEPVRRGSRSDGTAEQDHKLLPFLRAHWRVVLPMVIGFSMISICAFSLTAWVPTYLTRRFGWTPVQYGPMLSIISVVAAATLVVKGLIIDRLYAKGTSDIYLRFYTWLLLGTFPFAALTFFTTNVYVFYACYAVVQIVAIPVMIYVSPTVQVLAPNQLRGQLIGMFLMIFTLLGLGVGPTFVGALTDFVFGSEDKLGYSLGCVLLTGMPIAWISIRLSLSHFRRAIADRLETR